MMKFSIYSMAILFYAAAQAQVPAPLAVEKHIEGYYKLSPLMDIRLFDLNEIAERKIDTAYIIRHPASWEPGFPNACSYDDTLEIYCFDKSGRIIQWSYFQGVHGEYSTTFHYDTLGNIISRSMGKNSVVKNYPTEPVDTSEWKSVVTRKKMGSDSVITETIFWKFKSGLDTAFVITRVINENGLLTEIISRINKRNKREVEDVDHLGESTYHFKYRYDDQKRLVYFLTYDYKDQPNIYRTVIYAPLCQIIETYDAVTDKLLGTDVQLKVIHKGIVTISTNYEQITLTPVEENSKLYKLKTISRSGEYPYIEYYEISYKSHL